MTLIVNKNRKISNNLESIPFNFFICSKQTAQLGIVLQCTVFNGDSSRRLSVSFYFVYWGITYSPSEKNPVRRLKNGEAVVKTISHVLGKSLWYVFQKIIT